MNKNRKLFGTGALIGMVALSISFASVPRGKVTDDTAIYQNLSEIRVSKEGKPNFDTDIARLAQLESRYNERLPSLSKRPQLAGPIKRVAQQKYKFTGTAKKSATVRQ